MSRSRRKAIIKGGTFGSEYWRPVRREWKQRTKHDYYLEDFYLRNNRSICNDWDFCDYKLRWEFDKQPTRYFSREMIEKQVEHYRRK